MNKSKLAEIFFLLSPYERNQLQKFVHSPFHNQHAGVTALFGYLDDLPSPDPAILDRKIVFKSIFPRETFNDLKFRHTCSYLLRLIEDFLAWKELQEDGQNRDIYLLKAYRSRNMSKAFDSGWNAVAKSFRNSEIRDLNYHYCHYQLFSEKYNRTGARSIEVHPLLLQINDELDIYFIINKLKQACNMLSHQRMFNTTYSFPMLEEIIAHIHRQNLQQIPEVGIYFNAYMVLTDEGEEHFLRLKEQIARYYKTFRQEEMRDIYLLAINYCITRLNKGEMRYTREVFDIYKEGIENGVLFENGVLSPWTYKNIAAAGLKLNEIAWTENFITSGRDALPKPYRNSFFVYNTAKLDFARKDYRSVARALNNVEIEDLFTNIDAKVTLVKTYFEMAEYHLLDYLLDNLGQLLRRKKVMAYHRSNYSNFISFVKRLVNLKTYDPGKKKRLTQDIVASEILTEREWLMEKLEEI